MSDSELKAPPGSERINCREAKKEPDNHEFNQWNHENEGVSGSEGGGGGGITLRGDERGFRRRETQDLKMKISCKISHRGLQRVRVQMSFVTDTGCRAGYGRFICGEKCVCRSEFIKTWIRSNK